MATARKVTWKYAPVWVLLFSTGASLFKAVGERYLLNRQWKVTKSDVATAIGGAVLGLITFRTRFGNKTKGVLTR